jgi:uncharacterized membrane protein
MSIDLEVLDELVRALEDPRATVFLFLVKKRRQTGPPAISRKMLLSMTNLPEYTLDRTLRWLVQKDLISKYRNGAEMVYYANL